MKAIVSGGGTGGHIYPAIAIADKIMAESEDSEVLYVGNDIGLEKDLVPGSGYPLKFVSARWWDKKNIFEIMATGFVTMKGVRESLKIMKKFKPDVVVGTGGFVCVPVMYAGHKYGAKCYIHEQNAYPGVANRALERFVDKVFLGFPEAGKFFKQPEKHINAGNPVRERFFKIDRKTAREKLEIDDDKFVIFAFGGSQGAEGINKVVWDLMKAVNGRDDIILVFNTGELYIEEIKQRIEDENLELADNIWIKSYITDMENYLAGSDLAITRSGALSLSEITVCGTASIMIPSPNVTGNHQYYNAKSVTDRGGAILIEEKDLTSERLISEVLKIKNEPELLAKMSKAARACAPDAAMDIIYSELLRGTKEKKHGRNL